MRAFIKDPHRLWCITSESDQKIYRTQKDAMIYKSCMTLPTQYASIRVTA